MTLDVDKLLASETKRVKLWQGSRTVPSLAGYIQKLSPEDFVKRTYALHETLVERWGGWSFHGPLGEIAISEETKQERAAELWQELQREFNRAVCGEHAEGLKFGNDDSLYAQISLPAWGDLATGAAVFRDKNLKTTSRPDLASRQVVLTVGFYRRELTKEEIEKLHKQSKYTSGWEHVQIKTNCRAGERVTAAVFRAIEETKAPKDWKTLFEKFFQRCGEQLWNAGKISLACSVSCSPLAFLRLGHYGEKSCFANGKQHSAAKFWLAADMPDTFVVVAYTPRSKDGKVTVSQRTGNRLGKVAGRAWGMLLSPGDAAYVTNFYMLGFEQLEPQIKALLQDALGIAPEARFVGVGKILEGWKQLYHALTTKAVYLNPDGVVLTTDNKISVQCRDIAEYASLFGLHTNAGHGPEKQVLRWAAPGMKPDGFEWNIDLIATAREWAETKLWQIFERPAGGL